MLKKRAFTLLEMILVIIASGTLLTTIFSVLTTLPKVKVFNDARQTLIQESNDIMNRFWILFQDYTVDYEEYFNRQMVGCNETDNKQGSAFERNINSDLWHCDMFTAYGNENDWDTQGGTKKHKIKHVTLNETIPQSNNNKKMSYGQYKALFRDVGSDTDGQQKYNQQDKRVWDADDEDLGKGPDAIANADNIKELYLISHDKSRRLLLRRKVEKDENGKVIKSTIQFLKLRGFDAGNNHNFQNESENYSTVFDWEIDTWACDYGEGFTCKWTEISPTLYPKYKLPNDIDDGREDLFSDSIEVEDFTIGITPTKDPDLAWADDNAQINPYIKITLTTKLNQNKRQKKLGKMLEGYTFTLQSSFDTRWFYLK